MQIVFFLSFWKITIFIFQIWLECKIAYFLIFWIINIYFFQIWLRMQNIIFLNFLDYKYLFSSKFD